MGEKFQALVVENDIERRMRLKQATMMVPSFGAITPVNDIHEAHNLIKQEGNSFNIVFLSDRLGSEDANQFILQAKKVTPTEDAAFVYVLPTQEDLSAIIAQQMVAGMDGFLCEPYSVEALSDIADLAAKIKLERSESRRILATRLLMKEIVDQISTVAQIKALGGNILKGMRRLKNLCSTFDDADEEMKAMYNRIAMEEFEEVSPPAPSENEKYKGVSKRVQQRLEKKVLQKLESKAAKED